RRSGAARRARPSTIRMRGSVRVAGISCELAKRLTRKKLSTTEDAEDTEQELSLCSASPVSSAVESFGRCGARVRRGAAPGAVSDARPEANVGHPAAGYGPAGARHLRAPHSRLAVEQHPEFPSGA